MTLHPFNVRHVAKSLPDSVRISVLQAEADSYPEGGIEALLNYNPTATRDEAVDLYDAVVQASKGPDMNLGKDIEHGGYPTSETRTISMKRADADREVGIGRKGRFDRSNARTYPAVNRMVQESAMNAKKVVDTPQAHEVGLLQPQGEATETNPLGAQTMNLSLSKLSKNGRAAIYSGARFPIRFSLSSFPEKTAPQTIEVPEGIFLAAAEPKVKLTKEERAEARKNAPKPTLAELAKRAQDRADKLAAKAAAAEAAL